MTVLVKKKSHFYQFVFPLLSILLLIIPSKCDFSVWTLDVGQGDCNVIFTDEGNCFVLDCGSTSKYDVGEKILIPFLKYHGVGSVDGVIITHPDADHMNGVLRLIASGEEENIKIEGMYLYEEGPLNEPQAWEELLCLAKEQEIAVYGIGQGDVLQTESFRMECIYPLDGLERLTGNASSLVMCAEYGEFRGLFTGDLEADGERKLLMEYADREVKGDGYDFLKVGHHGSSGSSSSEFLQWVNPTYAVISCGENNSYGHPHAETLERLGDVGSEVLTTPECGAIKVVWPD